MKALVFILFFFSALFGLDTTKILEQLEQLSNKDSASMLEKEIDGAYNPFDPAKIGEVKEKSPDTNTTEPAIYQSEPTKLQAIFDDRRVKIDGRWYDKNESVDEYSIEEITENSVVLKNGDKIKKLFIFEQTILKAK